MNNIIKLAIIGGAAYLAYDYFTKREKNKANGNAIANGGAKAPITDAPAVVDAEMQEEGEEGMAVAEPMSNFMASDKGWDSNTVSYGM